MQLTSCPHDFLKSRSDGVCPMCAPPANLTCTHDWLRERNGGMCPLCHPTLTKYGMAPDALWAQVREEKRRRLRARCLKSVATFFRESWHVLEPTVTLEDSWMFDELGRHVQTVFNRWRQSKTKDKSADDVTSPFQNFLANLPPGTAKSRFISVCFVAWAWLHDPTMTVMALSVSPDVAKRDADLCRQLIESEWYRETFRPRWRLQEDANAIGYFRIITEKGVSLGSRRSFGITAKIIGKRSDLLLLDDPHDPNDILNGHLGSLTTTIERWNGIYNRVNEMGGSMRMCIMQRVHKLDLSNYMLSQTEQRWLHFNVPLTRKETQTQNKLGWEDPRPDGGVLMPTRYTKAVVRAEQDRLGDLAWAWLEQDPREFGGAIFKSHNFKFYRLADAHATTTRPPGSNSEPAIVLEKRANEKYFDREVITVDCNMAGTTAKARGSYVGLQTWGLIGYDRFLINDFSAPLGFDDMIDAITREISARPGVTKVLVENKALGPPAILAIKKVIASVIEVEPSGSKEGRARACTMQVNAGRVWLPEGASFLQAYCAQVYSFPATPDGRNDRVDATTQFLNHEVEDDSVARYLKLAKN